MKELEKLRAEWSSIIAHDLRQPLNAIVLNARGALRGLRTSSTDLEAARKAIEALEHAAKRLNRMISEMLEFDRMEAGKIRLGLKPLDINELIRDAVDRHGGDHSGVVTRNTRVGTW